ncbi:MAG TPA: phosphoribosylformylglycinamidine synthase subunit PurL [Candidatus Kapabacteria bacterium]|nr:phosphoribosylformylglycinamidine synthase subunit PurL [Candidatus Kapabacteria bacterium]
MTNIITTLEEAKKTALELGLLEEEFDKIVSILGGRVPTYTELGIFSVMWSEHCSYKNSITQLKTLPRKGKRLLVEAGEENAGLVDIGNGLAVAFKIESHNHPSAIEPYQGAATGVGGILRDIFTMGARPIAALDSLRFGDIENSRTKYLIGGVVHGIADYGNSFGIPTVAGELYFNKSYQGNPLVNAMAVGIVEVGKTVSATAEGVGNAVMIVGSSTGRDGIHGASLLASAVFSKDAEDMRPTVQVGDPFTEKLLLEATLEAIAAKLVVGMQDMGAAGISCSTSEMSFKSSTGMEIELDKVPLREATMSSYEIMLSESQERMLVVVKPENVGAIKAIFDKWDLQAEVIGKVTDTGRVVIRYHGETVSDIPAKALALGGDMTPVYQREIKEPAYLKKTSAFDLASLPDVNVPGEMLKKLLGSVNIASKRWVTEQYDSMVRTNTLDLQGADAAVIRIKDTTKGLAVKTDCNSRYAYLNPYRGGMLAVVESARNVACVGARPIAITNCLNFGNPYDPEVYYQFTEAIRGMGDACRALDTPVTGGNVSFYNQSPDGAIYPTPTIGMLGILDNTNRAVSAGFKDEGDAIILLTAYEAETPTDGIGGSEYLALCKDGAALGNAPYVDLPGEARLIDTLVSCCDRELLNSAHDISDGGLGVTLAESCFAGNIGAAIDQSEYVRTDVYLFAERQGRVVVSAAPDCIVEIFRIAQKNGVKAEVIGSVGGTNLVIENTLNESISELREIYESAIPQALDAVAIEL